VIPPKKQEQSEAARSRIQIKNKAIRFISIFLSRSFCGKILLTVSKDLAQPQTKLLFNGGVPLGMAAVVKGHLSLLRKDDHRKARITDAGDL
jgi:hypothetical protein